MSDDPTATIRTPDTVAFVLNGDPVEVPDEGDSLLGALRDRLGVTSTKDGCSPQGQCGCCTVLVDAKPRVACVTPVRRVRGRTVTTLEGMDPARRERWADAFCATGGSQCGFCTPGIIMRLDGLADGEDPGRHVDDGKVDQALLAHLCRCTGWQTITEAFVAFGSDPGGATGRRDLDAAARRAELEGGVPQRVAPEVALGLGRFAADTAPDGSLIAVPGADGWFVGETLMAARRAAGKVQGRRTTAEHDWPLALPEGEWDVALRTTWVDPAYLETDASWCEPGGEPWSPVANGGAFGAKLADGVGVADAARRLADEHGRPVLALAGREDAIRLGPKRPPVAGGAMADGTGVLRVVATPGVAEAIAAVAPGLRVEEVTVSGPPTSAAIRAAGWAEAAVLLAGARAQDHQRSAIEDGVIKVGVRCGDVLDPPVLRSYCIGAAHMAWSWLTGEALTVDADGVVHDLTVRSLGVVRAIDTPPIEIELHRSTDGPVNGSDAVFAAVAAAGWLAVGRTRDWPVGLPESRAAVRSRRT